MTDSEKIRLIKDLFLPFTKPRKYLVKNIKKYIIQYKYYPILEEFIEYYKNEICYFDNRNIIFFYHDLTEDELDFMKKCSIENKKSVSMNGDFHCLQLSLTENSFCIKYNKFHSLTHFDKPRNWFSGKSVRSINLTINADLTSYCYFKNKKSHFPVETNLRTLQILNEALFESLEKNYLINSIYKGYEKITGSYIYKDVYNDFCKRQTNNPFKISELKNYWTKKDLYLTKKEIRDNINIIGNRTLNKLSFTNLNTLYCYIKYFGNYLLPFVINELIVINEPTHFIPWNYDIYNQKEIALNLLSNIFSHLSSEDYIARDIINMLKYFSLKEIRKIKFAYPTKKFLNELHDLLVNKLTDENFEKIFHIPRNANYPKNSIYLKIAENLPEGWNLLLPKDLITEGRLMHNCIGSYCEQVVKNKCGLYSGTINQHRYNAELFFDKSENKLFINQLYGYCNSEPIKEDVKDFIDYVENFNKNIL